MRAVERRAIDSGKVTGRVLMERAGAAVVAALHSTWPRLLARAGVARVLCGPGNNGGDGFVIARLLAAQGWQVHVVVFGDTARLPPDARASFDLLNLLIIDGASPPDRPFDGDISIDAVFGIGLARPITDPALCAWLADHDRFTQAAGASLAVDVPSGLDADSGRVLQNTGNAICAHSRHTVTFHRAKPGHYLAAGPEYCGALTIADIGL